MATKHNGTTTDTTPSPETAITPTLRFRRESWAELQRMLDPLGNARPLRSAS